MACATCRTEFTVKASRAKQNSAITCSKECLSTLRSRNRVKHFGTEGVRQATCATCAQTFTRKPSQLAKYGQSYCSRTCANVGRSVPNLKLRKGRVVPCRACGTPVWRTPATLQPNTYCSRICAGGAPRRPRADRIAKPCAHCGKVMSLLPSGASRYRFCSLSCAANAIQGEKRGLPGKPWAPESRAALSATLVRKYGKEWAKKAIAHAEMMRGAGNPRWQGGRSVKPYAPGFTETVKRRIAHRDEQKCRICGAERGHGTHAVHHIDGGKFDHSGDNLVLLCRSCHSLLHHGKVELP